MSYPMSQEITDEFLARYFARETNPVEDAVIEKWAADNISNYEQFHEAKQAWNQSFRLNTPEFSSDQSFHKVSDFIYQENQRSKSNKWRFRFAAAIALMILTSALLYIIQTNQNGFVTQTTAFGERLEVKLSDGSLVILNVGSSITYPKHFDDDIREVVLSGEAFFKVKRDESKPFIIQSAGLQTKVLGTSFNIEAYEGQKQIVTVATGKVSVSTSDAKVFLEPHQQAIFENEHLSKSKADLNDVLAWQTGTMNFKNTSLEQVLVELERWYYMDITIKNSSIANCVFTGQFKNEKLLNVLEVLKEALGISYEVKSNRIYINGKGCNNQK
jgi:ferric-dicitrate binding protein FerR (iron transport regulator)